MNACEADTVRAWASLPGGHGLNRAGELLESFDGNPLVEMVDFAEAWVDLFDNHDRARSCIDRAAETVASEYDDDLAVYAAIAYDRVLGDLDAANRCLVKARVSGRFSGVKDLHQVACGRRSLLEANSLEATAAILRDAEALSSSFSELQDCCNAWIDLLNDAKSALAAAAKAESLAESVYDLGWIVFTYDRCGDRNRARAAFERLMSAEGSSVDSYCRIAEAVSVVPDLATIALQRAKKVAETSAHWIQISVVYWEDLDVRAESIEALRSAELVARSTLDWLNVAEQWKFSKKPDQMKHALDRAIKAAKTDEERQNVANFR